MPPPLSQERTASTWPDADPTAQQRQHEQHQQPIGEEHSHHHQPSSPAPRSRVRPMVSEQVRVIRDLWLLREQARVQAAERHFLNELQALLTRTLANIAASNPQTQQRRPHPRQEWERRVAAHSENSGNDGNNINVQDLLETPTDADPAVENNELVTYESNPPPRDEENAPVRERLGHTYAEVQELRLQQRVTNLSPEFRALLEGNAPPEDERRGLVRTRSWGDDLTDQRAVSGTLESSFRHELEAVLVRRGPRRGPRRILPPGSPHRRAQGTGDDTMMIGNDNPHGQATDDSDHMQHHSSRDDERPSLEAAVRALREEVAVLKNVIGASFDMQLDIQRAIRQEVSAAMHRPQPVALPCPPAHSESDTSSGADEGATGEASASAPIVKSAPPRKAEDYKPAESGTCIVCLEARIDAMLYGCGHMCSCAMCGRHLIASGQACPICRAPIRDVVRVYMVAED